MIVRYPEYFSRFSCLASECPDTCCRGWEIQIDRKTLERYKSETGFLKEKLGRWVDFQTGSLKFKMESAYFWSKACAVFRKNGESRCFAGRAAGIRVIQKSMEKEGNIRYPFPVRWQQSFWFARIRPSGL